METEYWFWNESNVQSFVVNFLFTDRVYVCWFQAKGYLEKALKLDPNNLDAVYAMATILGQQQQYDRAIKL